MTTSVRVKRGTRAQIEAAKASNQLRQGEPYLITDEGRLAVGTGAGAYAVSVNDDDSRLSNSREWTADTVSQVEAEAGTATTRRAWTAERVKQAVAAWWSAAKGSLTGPVAIDADSASPALKITQTGTGNILELYDETGDTTPFIVNSSGNVGLGSAGTTNVSMYNSKPITSNSTAYANFCDAVIQPDVTLTAAYYVARPSTSPSAFALTDLILYDAQQGVFGSGSSVNTQYGFRARPTLVGAATNYGFYSQLPSGTGRYNFYASGTAPNYYAGLSTFAGGAVSTSPSVALGYGTGAGGTVTQATGKSYSVTLNKPTGKITTASSELTVGELAAFKVNNSIVKATDTVTVSTRQSVDEYASIKYRVFATGVAAGAFTVIIENIYGTSLSEAVEINFTVTPGATS